MLNITFNQIRLFEAVARHKSFTKAAKELNISQPAVSSQLKKLADSIGNPLVEVVGRKVYLTKVGETTYQQFQTLLDNFDDFSTRLKASQTGGLEGELSIAGVSASKYFLPFILAKFLKQHPKVTPKLSILNKSEIINSLQNQQHQLLITGRVFADIDANFEAFTDQTLEVVAAPTDRLSSHAKLSLKSLTKQNLILPAEETSIRQAVNQVLAEEGLKITPYLELNSYELIKQSVIAGLGIAVLPADAFRLEEYSGHIVRLNVDDFPINKHWYCAYHDKKNLSLVSLAFLDFLHCYPIETHLKKIYSTVGKQE
ncbi:LysR family transcriptional regulator [Thiosulfatimonas sediminis]|uniref:LysR family transcriptional regulator n=1 Tax=Thiosulfatimonas sediminis TaxID=2675054 RepID=A0A6F8PW87_9GAMM|nr:LysR family transcriptional regulator [Thiosulfatimonas sediminis]BBP46391.1 LysR family transcriptional regulator [Thiosulfatimonas sediminis]